MADPLKRRLEILDKAIEDKEAKLRALLEELRKNPENRILLAERDRLIKDLADLSARQKNLKDKLSETPSGVVGLQSVLPAIGMLVQLQLAQFDYSASKASSSRQGYDFKAQLQTFYGNKTDTQRRLRCMLLDVKLPMTLVGGAHLFKYCWRAQMPYLLGLADVNDARNGLLLFKPLVHAFNDSRICFLDGKEAGEPTIRLKLLDPSLKDVKLWDYAETYNLCEDYEEHQIDSYAATVTFGELQGKALVFENDNRPYKRCLRFQVVQAARRAKANGWLPAEWTPSDDLTYNSEDAREQMDAWLTLAAQAPPPDADSSEDE